MVSLAQSKAVERLLSEGWQVEPAPAKITLGGPTVMRRANADGSMARIAVIPDGGWEAAPNNGFP